MDQKVTIITGRKGEGKTTFVLSLIDALRSKGYDLRGLVSLAKYTGKMKSGIIVENIASGERRDLAIFDPGWDPERSERVWRFDFRAVEWGNNVLQAIQKPCDVIVVDEIGYLELEKNSGWLSVFKLLDQGQFIRAVIVIRQSLLSLAKERWGNAEVVDMSKMEDSNAWISNWVEKLSSQKEERKE